MGAPAFMEIRALNRLVGEGPRISGVHLIVDPAKRETLYTLLKDMPMVAGVSLLDEAQRAFRQLLDDNTGTFTFVALIFATMIAFGVVYNTARVALSERSRELASLRVLGFTKGEAAYVLLGELAFLALVALPIGAALGYGFTYWLVSSLSNELYRLPMTVSTETFAWGVLVILVAALVSGFMAWRDINKLDLVGVLKTRD
jgi:putative ABC transport system permease protein